MDDWLTVSIFVVASFLVIVVIALVNDKRTARTKQRVQLTTELAVGTIVSTAPTGHAGNDQRELDFVIDVETAEGQTFRATARKLVLLSFLSQYEPGTFVPVRYRPGDTSSVILDDDATQSQVERVMQKSMLAQGKITPEQIRIGKEGIPAKAVVIEMDPTGKISHGEAVVDLMLRVTRPDGSNYDARVQKTLSQAALPNVQPGSVLDVKYLPSDEQQLAIALRVG